MVSELKPMLTSGEPGPLKPPDETVKAVIHSVNLKHGVKVDEKFVLETYAVLNKLHFLGLGLQSASYCSSRFGQPEHSTWQTTSKTIKKNERERERGGGGGGWGFWGEKFLFFWFF